MYDSIQSKNRTGHFLWLFGIIHMMIWSNRTCILFLIHRKSYLFHHSFPGPHHNPSIICIQLTRERLRLLAGTGHLAGYGSRTFLKWWVCVVLFLGTLSLCYANLKRDRDTELDLKTNNWHCPPSHLKVKADRALFAFLKSRIRKRFLPTKKSDWEWISGSIVSRRY